MEAGTLAVIYEARSESFDRTTDSVERRLKSTASTADRTSRHISQAYERAGSAGERLLGRLPGANQLTQFRQLSNDLGAFTKAEGGATAASGRLSTAVTALGGAGVIAGVGVAAVGVAAVGSGVGLFKLAEHAASAGSRFHDLSIETGLSVETLSGVALQARQSGTSLESLGQATFFLQRNLAAAAAGNKQLQATFEQLGVRDVRAALDDADGTFRQVVSSLGTMTSAGERNAVGAKVMGRGFRDLSVFLKDTGGDIDAVVEKSRRAGMVMSGEATDAADEFGDSLDEMGMRASAAARSIGGALIPAANQLFRVLNAESQNTGSIIGAVSNRISALIQDNINKALVLIAAIKTANDLPVAAALATAGGSPVAAAGFLKERFNQNLGEVVKEATTAPPETKPTRGPKDTGGAGGGSRGASRTDSTDQQIAQARERLLATGLQTAERIYSQDTFALQRQLDLRLSSIETYTTKALAAEDRLLADKQRIFAQELAAAESTINRRAAAESSERGANRAGIERTRLAELSAVRGEYRERDLAAQADWEQASARLDDARLQHQREAHRRAAEDAISTLESAHRTMEALETRAVERGRATNEDAVRARFTRQSDVFDARADEINTRLTQATGNPEAQRAVINELDRLFDEIVRAQLQYNADIRGARRDDLQNAQDYTRTLRDTYAQVVEANQQISQIKISALDNNPLRRGEQIGLQAELDKSIEQERTRLLLTALGDRRALIRQALKNRVGDEMENARLLIGVDAQIEASRRLSVERLKDIDRQANEERLESLRQIGQDLAGTVNEAVENAFKGWDDLWKGLLQSASQTLIKIGQEIVNAGFEKGLTGETKGSDAGGIVGAAANALLKKMGMGARPEPVDLGLGSTATKGGTGATRERVVGTPQGTPQVDAIDVRPELARVESSTREGAQDVAREVTTAGQDISREVQATGQDTSERLSAVAQNVDRANSDITAAIREQSRQACQCAEDNRPGEATPQAVEVKWPDAPRETPRVTIPEPRVRADDLGVAGGEVLDVERATQGAVAGQDNVDIQFDRVSQGINEVGQDVTATRTAAQDVAREVSTVGQDTAERLSLVAQNVDRANTDITAAIREQSRQACQCDGDTRPDSAPQTLEVKWPETPRATTRETPPPVRVRDDSLGVGGRGEVLDVERATQGAIAGQDDLDIQFDRVSQDIDSVGRDVTATGDKTTQAVERASADNLAAQARAAEHIVNSLTPKPEGFWKGLLKSAISGAVSGATGAITGGLLGGGGGGGFLGGGGIDPEAGGGPVSSGPPTLKFAGRRARGGYVSKGVYQVGEEGREFVLDANTTEALGSETLNKLNAIDSKTDLAAFKREQIFQSTQSMIGSQSRQKNTGASGSVGESTTNFGGSIARQISDFNTTEALGSETLNKLNAINSKTDLAAFKREQIFKSTQSMIGDQSRQSVSAGAGVGESLTNFAGSIARQMSAFNPYGAASASGQAGQTLTNFGGDAARMMSQFNPYGAEGASGTRRSDDEFRGHLNAVNSAVGAMTAQGAQMTQLSQSAGAAAQTPTPHAGDEFRARLDSVDASVGQVAAQGLQMMQLSQASRAGTGAAPTINFTANFYANPQTGAFNQQSASQAVRDARRLMDKELKRNGK